MKLKETYPIVGRTVSYRGEDMRVIKVTQRRGRLVYIGQPFGSHLTYYINPTQIDEVL